MGYTIIRNSNNPGQLHGIPVFGMPLYLISNPLPDVSLLAMVNIIENRSVIEGVVLSVSASTDPKGYYQAAIQINKSTEVENYPNLAKADEGKVIFIKMLPQQASAMKVKPSTVLSCTVRKAFGQIYFAVTG